MNRLPEVGERHLGTLNKYIDNRDLFIQTEMFAELKNAGFSDEAANQLVSNSFSRAKSTWETSLSPFLRERITEVNLPLPIDHQSFTTVLNIEENNDSD